MSGDAGPDARSGTPDARRWWLGVGLDGRYGDTRALDGAVMLGLGRERPFGPRRAGLRLAAGASVGADAGWPGNSASFRRFPVRAGAYLALRAGPGFIEPGLDAGADLLISSLATPPPGGSKMSAHLAPFAAATLGYALPLTRRFFVRAAARGGAAVPYDFVPVSGSPNVVWSTPRTYLEFGVESGVSFP